MKWKEIREMRKIKRKTNEKEQEGDKKEVDQEIKE